MSSPLSLSGHPYPILQDENALLLLSMIERAGLVAEIDLRTMSGVEDSLLQRYLYRLQVGKFIEHGTNFVRLTETGRDCLDRLSLYEEILEDILGSLDVHGQERRACSRDLRAYRKSCFRLYQNSVCTVLQWQRLAPFLMLDVEKRRRFSTIVVKSLLARDLRNWRMHVPPDEIQASVEKYSSESEGAVHRIIWQILLDKPDHERVSPRAVAAIRSGAPMDIDVFVEWVRAFHRFQAKCGPDLWVNVWLDKSGQLLKQLKEPRRIEDPSAFEFLYTSDLCQRSPGELHHFAHFNETWKPGAAGQRSDHFHGAYEAGIASSRMLAKPFVPTPCHNIQGERISNEGAREKISWQAALWYLQLKSQLSVAERCRFMRWLMRSPRHICAFMLTCRQDQRLTRAIQAKRDRPNVTHVNWWKGSLMKPVATRGTGRIFGWSVAAAIVMTLLMIVSQLRVNIGASDNTIATAVDKSTTRRLEDGSRVSLGAGSTLRLEFTDKHRHVHLLEGKAVFEVAEDTTRPFVVNTLLVDIAATVSKFAVKIDTGVEVEVYDGSVEVLRPGAAAGKPVITVRRGETLRVPMGGLRAVVADSSDGLSVPLIGGSGDGSDPGAERTAFLARGAGTLTAHLEASRRSFHHPPLMSFDSALHNNNTVDAASSASHFHFTGYLPTMSMRVFKPFWMILFARGRTDLRIAHATGLDQVAANPMGRVADGDAGRQSNESKPHFG